MIINQKRVSYKEGDTILQAAQDAGFHIPTLCYHPMLVKSGHCRVCLVEDVSHSKLVPACITEAKNGMVLETTSAKVDESVKADLRFLRYNLFCFEISFCSR